MDWNNSESLNYFDIDIDIGININSIGIILLASFELYESSAALSSKIHVKFLSIKFGYFKVIDDLI